jgi:NAD(P)-dependent dehydrogenase (short-subunit alcohol dehydrogenase family)
MQYVAYPNDGVRVNSICPGMTDTKSKFLWFDWETKSELTDEVAQGVVPLFRANNTAVNTPEDVARLVLALGSTDSINGKAILAIGARAWDFEDGLDRTISQWLGEMPSQLLEESSDVIQRVSWRP